MWVADMDFAVAAPIQQALQERLEHPVFGYTTAPESLNDAIADHLLAEYNWTIDKQWLVYLPGVVTGLAVACKGLCEDGDDIMVNPPIYHHFYDSHEDKRQNLIKVPLHKAGGRWTYNVPAMSEAVTDKTSMIMMCSPHNPTGTVFSHDELNAVAKMCKDNNMLMVSDEIHCDLVIDKKSRHIPTAVACPEYADHIITLMSGSKTWNLAGLNTSFAIISNPAVREAFCAAAKSIVPLVPPLAYVATEAAYKDAQEWRSKLLDYLAGNFELISREVAAMPGLSLEPLSATYLAWIDATELGMDNTQQFFEENGVGLSSGEQFGQPQYLRLNFACPRSVLKEGLARMAKALAKS